MTTKNKVKKIVDAMGGVNQVRNDLREYNHNSFLITSKKGQLTRKYPDSWVAMSEGKIVAVEKEFDELLVAVDAQGIDRDSLVVEFLDTGTRCMIL